MSLLTVAHLSISFQSKTVVEDVSFHVNKGECVALIGASGSGKSVTALSLLGLVQNARVTGSVQLDGQELTTLTDKQMQAVRGRRIGLIFQEPMTSLNPLHSVADQVSETMMLHKGWGKDKAAERAHLCAQSHMTVIQTGLFQCFHISSHHYPSSFPHGIFCL